jgi:glycosyltransferase involved in cell wall biosynthesis
MNSLPKGVTGPSALIYEPRVEGHHLSYLKFITEDLLGAGFHLTLAMDTRQKEFQRANEQMAELLKKVRVIPAYGAEEGGSGSGRIGSVAACLANSGAELAFLISYDDVASGLFRRAAFGLLPPRILRGRHGGIFLRPRFLAGRGFSPNLWLKSIGFTRLLRQGWFRHLLLLDPFLHARLKAKEPAAPVFFLPDPFPDDFVANAAQARRHWDIALDKRVLLFYGGGYRRKGLQLVVAALRAMAPGTPAFLLFAGHQPDDAASAGELEQLSADGRARVINRYVSEEEEKLLFAASDFVVLPYQHHFGSSGVLARAAGAGKPVIASDEQLVGRLVREHGLGLLFPSGNTAALRQAIAQATNAAPGQTLRWREAAVSFAGRCSRAAFREALLAAFRAT